MLNINLLISKFRNIQNGYDPISEQYAVKYFNDFEYEGKRFDYAIVEKILSHFHGVTLDNLTLIDLGAGPGQYSAHFARLGFKVFHQDVSRNFINLAKAYHKKQGVNVTYHHNYMEESLNRSYNVIFSNVSYYYCFSDRKFAELIRESLAEKGVFIAILHTERRLKMLKGLKGLILMMQFKLNEITGLKVGHPPMSSKVIPSMFNFGKEFELDILPWGIDTMVIVRKI